MPTVSAAIVGRDRTDAPLTVEDVDRRRALVPAAVLLVAGVLAAIAPAIGVVDSYDGSAVDAWTVAGWVAVLPGLLAVIVTAVRPVAGLAVTAGAGVVGIGRMVGDLAVLFSPNAVARPELFVETTTRAQPFSAAVGGAVLLFAGLLMTGAGLLAATWLAGAVGLTEDRVPLGFGTSSDEDADAPGRASRPRRRNSWLLFTGFAGVALMLGGSVPVVYVGGFLDERFIPVGGDVAGTIGVMLVALAGAVAVLCAAALPRELALPLLSGFALAAAVPALTAVVAVLAGAPTSLSSSVWFVLVGAVVTAGAGLLTRVRLDVADRADAWSDRPGFRFVVGGVGIAAAIAAGLAAALPQLHVDGHAEQATAGVVPQGAALPIVFAGVTVILAIGGALMFVGPAVPAGRPVLMVAVGGVAFAVAGALMVLNTLATATRTAAGTESALYGLVTVRVWTAGPGLWLGVLALLLSAVAAVLAGLDDRAAGDAQATVPDDEELARSRQWRGLLAALTGVFAVIVLAVPTYRTVLGSSATLLNGFALSTWGVWALLVVVVAALVRLALDSRPVVVAAFGAAAAGVVSLRLLVPGVLSSAADFAPAAGTALTWALIVVLLAVTAAATILVRMVSRTAPAALPAAETPPSSRTRGKGRGQ